MNLLDSIILFLIYMIPILIIFFTLFELNKALCVWIKKETFISKIICNLTILLMIVFVGYSLINIFLG